MKTYQEIVTVHDIFKSGGAERPRNKSQNQKTGKSSNFPLDFSLRFADNKRNRYERMPIGLFSVSPFLCHEISGLSSFGFSINTALFLRHGNNQYFALDFRI